MKPLKYKKTGTEMMVSKHAKEIRKMLKNEGCKHISAKTIANT